MPDDAARHSRLDEKRQCGSSGCSLSLPGKRGSRVDSALATPLDEKEERTEPPPGLVPPSRSGILLRDMLRRGRTHVLEPVLCPRSGRRLRRGGVRGGRPRGEASATGAVVSTKSASACGRHRGSGRRGDPRVRFAPVPSTELVSPGSRPSDRGGDGTSPSPTRTLCARTPLPGSARRREARAAGAGRAPRARARAGTPELPRSDPRR
jgi:hypothetical protein